MSDTTPAILAEGLRKSFGGVCALDGVDLCVPQGTVLGLLGPNGAGKTTTVRILATLMAPDGGRATVAGHDVVNDAAALRSVVGLAGQFAAVDEHLTGRENLVLVGRLYHLGRRRAGQRADELLGRFGLAAAARQRVKAYSGGMRRRLDLAASLVGRPQVLFLDEPTAGLDPRSRATMWEVISELVSGGSTILLTTQYLEEADQLATSIAVIDHGRVIAEGTADQLKSRVGGEVLEVRVVDATQAPLAARALVGLSDDAPSVDAAAGMVRVSTGSGRHRSGGNTADPPIALAVRLLDAAEIAIADLTVRRPTLDDVFLALTGRAAEGAGPDAGSTGSAESTGPAGPSGRRS